MADNPKKKKSVYYSEIFNEYLNFSPIYRRNLIELYEMFDWLKDIGYNLEFSDYPEFFILMEWFNYFNLIKPFGVIHIPKNYQGQKRDLKKLLEEGYLCFPPEVYDINPKKNGISQYQWEFKKLRTNSLDLKKETDETIYLYHPIQFFQVITYLQGSSYKDLFSTKQYKEFYWDRRFKFNDYLINRIKNELKKEEKSIKDFIKEETSEGSLFHQFHGIYYYQNCWLISRSLLLWIKIEALFTPEFYGRKFYREINFGWQIPHDNKFKERIDEFYDWHQNVFNNFNKFFNEENFQNVNEFRVQIERYLTIDGLDHFIELFLRISSEKKNNLKGTPYFFVNMLEIVKTLRYMEHELIESFPNLREFIEEPKFYEPKYVFTKEDDEIEYNKKILLDYGIFQEEKFVIFVEGVTELILLEEWVRMMYIRTRIKISLKSLPSGKRTAFYFEYLIKDFKGSEFFLLLDADTPSWPEGKIHQLNGAKISQDAYTFFKPDFITANFSIYEVFEAFLSFFRDLKSEHILTKSEEQELLRNLMDKDEYDKYENIIENFLKTKFNDVKYKLKKSNYANHLLDVIINNFGKNKYPFEKILGNFIKKIQKIRFPDLEI